MADSGGRMGGGGIGRPVADNGGAVRASPSPAAGRCVGRMVVGPSGDTVRTGAGFGGAVRVRTTRGASAGAGVATDSVASATSAAGAAVGVAATTGSSRGAGSGRDDGVSSSFALRVAFLGATSSGCCSRRSPSASALRRTRSAWASSMDDEALFTPIPRVCERSRISLLVMPSSRASSCTRIFFVAKTFLHLCAGRGGSQTRFLVSHTSRGAFTTREVFAERCPNPPGPLIGGALVTRWPGAALSRTLPPRTRVLLVHRRRRGTSRAERSRRPERTSPLRRVVGRRRRYESVLCRFLFAVGG